ncbi:PorV/PorQ family protein [candidate division KSB1 bacterium]|nr:PorV/PorQ family protein [candidate division KSB1 bacterium]
MQSVIRFIRVFFVVLGLLNPSLFAADGDGGYAGAFLRMGAGVRGLSMGSAFAGVSDDVSAAYWNPAGLARVRRAQLLGAYSSSSLDRSQVYTAVAFPGSGLGTIAVSWLNLSIDDIDGRDAQGNDTGSFSHSENAFFVSFGKSLLPAFSVGANLKVLSTSLASHHAMGVSGDIGVLFRPSSLVAVGLTVTDVNSLIKWDTASHRSEIIPMTIRGGVSFTPTGLPLILAADIDKNDKQKARFHLGAEYVLVSSLVVRAGLDNGSLAAGLSLRLPLAGGGIENLDFAYGFYNDPIDAAGHRLSLCLTFGKTEPPPPSFTAPSLEGRVMAVVKGFAHIDLGTDHGIDQGSMLTLYRPQKNGNAVAIGQVRVVRVRSKASAVQVVQIRQNVQVRVGDRVRME